MSKIFVGCSGWSYWGWRKIFYPEDLPRYRWLKYYSEKFNTVEVNSTFYRLPSERMVKDWVKKTPDGFKFTVKAPKEVTHIRKFENVREVLNKFYRITDMLGEKLACILYQLPPSISLDMNFLNKMLSEIDCSKCSVIEFRDESWFNDEVYSKLKEKNIAFCSVSSSKLPEEIVKTSNFIYIRFHGKKGGHRYFYSEGELKEWAEKIKKSKANMVYCYFNNDYQGNAVKNALALKKILENY